MYLKNKIVPAIICALIVIAGIFASNNVVLAQNSVNNSTIGIEQMQQLINMLRQQIQQMIQTISQLKPLETCGNGICRFGETAATCAVDCAKKSCTEDMNENDCKKNDGKYLAQETYPPTYRCACPAVAASVVQTPTCDNGNCGGSLSNTDAGPENCAKEGESISFRQNFYQSYKCCPGLTNIENCDSSKSCDKSSNSICTYCSNGICGIGENNFNCSRDCN